MLRIANLGYQQHAMTADGLTLRVVGRDANWLNDGVYETDTLDVAPGESYDVIITLPAHSTGVANAAPDTYLFYDRNYGNDSSGNQPGFGGMATEIHVYPTTTALAAQLAPNDLGL